MWTQQRLQSAQRDSSKTVWTWQDLQESVACLALWEIQEHTFPYDHHMNRPCVKPLTSLGSPGIPIIMYIFMWIRTITHQLPNQNDVDSLDDFFCITCWCCVIVQLKWILKRILRREVKYIHFGDTRWDDLLCVAKRHILHSSDYYKILWYIVLSLLMIIHRPKQNKQRDWSREHHMSIDR